jgi:hypothetical protein
LTVYDKRASDVYAQATVAELVEVGEHLRKQSGDTFMLEFQLSETTATVGKKENALINFTCRASDFRKVFTCLEYRNRKHGFRHDEEGSEVDFPLHSYTGVRCRLQLQAAGSAAELWGIWGQLETPRSNPEGKSFMRNKTRTAVEVPVDLEDMGVSIVGNTSEIKERPYMQARTENLATVLRSGLAELPTAVLGDIPEEEERVPVSLQNNSFEELTVAVDPEALTTAELFTELETLNQRQQLLNAEVGKRLKASVLIDDVIKKVQELQGKLR